VAGGKIGGAYSFNAGDSSYIDVGVLDSSFPNYDFSVSLWFKASTHGASRTFGGIDLNHASTGKAYTWFGLLDGGQLYSYFTVDVPGNDPTVAVRTNGSFDDNRWRHIVFAVTHDSDGDGREEADDVAIYADGVLQAVTVANDADRGNILNASPFPDNFLIGRWYNSEYPFDGLIDEFAMWNRTLSTKEVEDLYNRGNGLAYPF
jgi:hypothetical protein